MKAGPGYRAVIKERRLKLFSKHYAALAAAVALSATGLAIAASGPAQAVTANARPVLVNCAGKATVRPTKEFILTCADANNYLKDERWSTWAATARGKATDEINNCVPACFDGKFHPFPAKVELWRPKAWPHHPGKAYFTRMTLTFTAKIPKGYHRHYTLDLWSRGV
jgi:hypothetical protein